MLWELNVKCLGQGREVRKHYTYARIITFLTLSRGFLNVTLFTPFHHRLYGRKYESTFILMINNGYLWVVELGLVCVCECVCTFCLFHKLSLHSRYLALQSWIYKEVLRVLLLSFHYLYRFLL